jgi:hypothetical protein
MTKVRMLDEKERFDLANEIVERICSDPDFDAFFMRFYNGKILDLDDDPIGEFEIQEKSKIKHVYTKKHSPNQIQIN